MSKKTIQERLWSRVNITDLFKCWEWQNALSAGYGQIMVNGKQTGTHRLSWELTYGKIPKGMFVLHKCDNRKCVNPAHLFLGTQKDNMQDMSSKYYERESQMAKSERGNDRYTIRIPDALRDTMLKRCKKDGITPSTLIRKALGLYLLSEDCKDECIKALSEDRKNEV